jgi:hypothetical protein
MNHEWIGRAGMVGNKNLRPSWQYPLAANSQLEHQGGKQQKHYPAHGIKHII